MPSRPAKITTLTGPDSVHVINQLFREIEGRLDDLQKQVPAHRNLKSTSKLAFGNSIPAGSTIEATVYLAGAHTSGVAHASPAQGIMLPAGLTVTAAVSAQNQVRVRLANVTGSPVAMPASTMSFNVAVLQ